MTKEECLENILLTNFRILIADVAYNSRFKNELDPAFILFIMYMVVFTNKLNRIIL